jgi:hypothetical protein
MPSLVVAVEFEVGQAFRAWQGGDPVGVTLVEFLVVGFFLVLRENGSSLDGGRHGYPVKWEDWYASSI